MMQPYKLLYLCADLLDFDGTRGDMLYLQSRLKERGIPHTVTMHQMGQEIEVTDFDFIYGGVCPQKYEGLYLDFLKQKVKGLQAYIQGGKPMLAIEQSFLFLGESLADGKTTTPLVGALPISVQTQESYTIGNILLDVKQAGFTSEINGFINTRYKFTSAGEGAKPFGNILLGKDFLWETGVEGLVYQNFFGTQLRGPLLPRNYDFCDFLIEKITGEPLLPLESKFEKLAKAKLTEDCKAFIQSGEQKKEYHYIN